MSELFRRVARVVVDDGDVDILDIKDLRVSFEVTRDTDRTPNSANITIYNLSADSRKTLQQDAEYIELEAGYEKTSEIIFEGDIRTVVSRKMATGWETVIAAGDGEKAVRSSRINESFGGQGNGKSIKDAIAKCAEAFTGVDTADAIRKIKEEPAERESLLYKILQAYKGYTATGKVEKEFSKLMQGYGRSWSVQNGKLQVLKRTETTDDAAIILNPASGLIGVPEGGDKGVVTCDAKLQPGFFPGRKVLLESDAFGSGDYRVESVRHIGDTRGQAWTSRLELTPL